ncbi:hypothetical protein [Eleftheria terrae]|uniref:hypothetical protein n=1 Tax=Eleftheria terrae TaxID=1597781 RepID=UPI00263B13F6|nr:hypothetical protein [Eleftheria terrae]WKB50504.1 hypothetical protein N7L95_00210 [Eleftheria terrae]
MDVALQDAKVLNDEDLTAGLPSKFFWGGIVASVAVAFLFKSVPWIGLLFAFVYFSAMYGIHKDDPKGADGWTSALQRPSHWSGASARRRRVVYLERE